MNTWLIDLLTAVECASSERAVYAEVLKAAQKLEFEYCAYGVRTPWPVSRPEALMISNYPAHWQERYVQQRYVEIDPTVRLGMQSDKPFVWTARLVASAPAFWEEARSAGLRVGWAQSSFGDASQRGMLTVARSATPLWPTERVSKERHLRVLTTVAHQRLSQLMLPTQPARRGAKLTTREVEVLQWTADGKTTLEIGDLLGLSECTVRFHIRNVITKLNVANKTAAAVYAAMNGLLG
ncbi:autoinducer binding domain-containing protein [Cupriavidus pauculus]|uniref:LuxR family transcriptional regulator n=1 Tax=Cupriavidus pauculus TaxID=82633 RepID=A0A2N5C6W6_9BURK|nr:autoinducer binding domain-containing protein [Cupriavidus pauculus]PLP97927.1 LuxR family transcriptional regulator [Cupriavidus pauculus]